VPLLRYENSRTVRRRRILRRLIGLLVLLGAVKLAQSRLGARAVDGLLAQFWQNRCMNHILPPDRLAYVAAPAGMQVPAHLGDFTNAVGSQWRGTVAAVRFPVELAELHSLAGGPVPGPWESLPGPVFLHGRTTPTGETRLVTVYALANNPAGWWTLVSITHPPIALGGTAPPPVTSAACWPLPKTPDDSVAVFAGQPNPTDRSAFTLHILINGRRQVVTGTLQPDGTVQFTSSTGLQPWSTKRAGALMLPVIPVAQTTACPGSILLPVD
jgi:hypothetical protein